MQHDCCTQTTIPCVTHHADHATLYFDRALPIKHGRTLYACCFWGAHASGRLAILDLTGTAAHHFLLPSKCMHFVVFLSCMLLAPLNSGLP